MGNDNLPPPACADHVGLWAGRLRDWLPPEVFDAHVHLGPPEAMGAFAEARLKEPLSTFASQTWEEALESHRRLFPGRRLVGVFGFPFPLREVDPEAANRYVVAAARSDPRLRPFLLAHPTDARPSRDAFDRCQAAGVRPAGFKPYFDLLGKSNYATAMPEFIPEGLLDLMDAEGLLLMLHTSGRGMGEPRNQEYVLSILERRRRLRVILAHMGRYLELREFMAFAESEVFRHPRLYLEMSSASLREVYERTLAEPSARGRLLFGTDLPFGLITGVEAWSQETGPVFVTRDAYAWSDPRAQRRFAADAAQLTHNTYHVIHAFRQALESVIPDRGEADRVKSRVFHDTAAALSP
jgi:hypothetical protein